MNEYKTVAEKMIRNSQGQFPKELNKIKFFKGLGLTI